jgi:phenylalanyl-tRNA synthetase beta chain
LHPEVERYLDVPGKIFVLELAGEEILQRLLRVHAPVSKFPSVRRDLALLLARETPAAQIVTILRQTLGNVLVDLRLFDLYQGKGIDLTEKSLGVGLTLQHPSATLTEEEIGHYIQKAVQALSKEVGAKLR